MIIPAHLHIETINGICTARCTMCTISTSRRKPSIMSLETFKQILNRFFPYRNHFQYLSLFWNGEPLLDPGIAAKVLIAKAMGFKRIGFATNCTELDYKKSRQLLRAGLDTIICSIDGISKETHESIRIGTDFHAVVKNVRRFIKLRNQRERTKVVIRFIKQKSNQSEWVDFKRHWEKKLDKQFGDLVTSFDVVDVDGKVKDYKAKETLTGTITACNFINDRMTVLSNGDVCLCCGDGDAKFGLGNVLETDPIEIYNGNTFQYYRSTIAAGRINELDLCKTCTIPRSQEAKQ